MINIKNIRSYSNIKVSFCFFKSNNLEINVVLRDSSTCVVSFSNYSNYPKSVDNNGFGNPFLENLGVSCVYVIARSNHWWQIPEIKNELVKLTEIISDYNRIITYGSSMGGYGSMLFSGLLNADRVISISPQFSIDRRKAPFENRWEKEYQKINFINDDVESLESNSFKYVFFTPEGNDNRQVGLYRKSHIENCFYYPLEFSGHPSGQYLLETGILSKLIKYLITSDDVDRSIISKIIRQSIRNRENSPTYIYNYIRSLISKNPTSALKELEKRLEKFPDNAKLQDLEVLIKSKIDIELTK